jgi:hypothetical protein
MKKAVIHMNQCLAVLRVTLNILSLDAQNVQSLLLTGVRPIRTKISTVIALSVLNVISH